MTALLSPGATFGGRYTIVRMLSHGGMGAVYEVVHRDTARKRALKVMLPTLLGDQDMRERFLREARVTAEVESENLVETFDAGIDAETEQPFLVMELLKGSDLETRLRSGPLDWEEVVSLLAQVARGLDKTHAAGIVHRDLKPENIFVTRREDGTALVKLLDFGIAKVVNESAQKKSTRSLGTPLYMAPEMLQRRANLTGAVDRYALGHIAYTLLVGEAYFETECRETDSILAVLPVIAAGGSEPPSRRAATTGVTFGPAFDAWFQKATHVDPLERFADAKDQIAALKSALEREPPQIEREGKSVAARTIANDAVTLAAEASAPVVPAKEQVSSAPTLLAGATPSGTRDFTVAVDSKPQKRAGRLPLVAAAALLSGVAVVAYLKLATPTGASEGGKATGVVDNAPMFASASNQGVGQGPNVAPASAAAPTVSVVTSTSAQPSAAPSVATSSRPAQPSSARVQPSARKPPPGLCDDPSRCR